MQVAETAETLDYIRGSNKPHKVRKFYAVFYTVIETRAEIHIGVSLPSIDLSIGVQTTFRAPLCLCRYKVFDRRKAQT